MKDDDMILAPDLYVALRYIQSKESMSEDDIAVIISFSGTTRHIKQINKLLKEKNIKIIWITSQKHMRVCV